MNRTLFAPLALAYLASPAFAHMGMMHGGCPAGQVFTTGEITVAGAFARAMPSGARVAGGYLTITSVGGDDRLVGARSAVSERIEMHEMAVENDMMRMSQVEDGIPILAGETVALQPGGFHLMFVAPSQEFHEGECVAVTLVFEVAGELDVQLTVGPVGARGPGQGAESAMHGEDHGHGHGH